MHRLLHKLLTCCLYSEPGESGDDNLGVNPFSQVTSQQREYWEARSISLVPTAKPPETCILPNRKALTPRTSLEDLRQESNLLSLPAELRVAIWKECLGGLKFHLYLTSHNKLTSFLCQNPNADTLCEPGICSRPNEGRIKKVEEGAGMLSLPLTCHQMYVFAIVSFATR